METWVKLAETTKEALIAGGVPTNKIKTAFRPSTELLENAFMEVCKDEDCNERKLEEFRDLFYATYLNSIKV